MTRYVCGFMFSPNHNRVALIRKNKPDWQKGLLNGMGGKIEDLEFASHTMVREFREETGLVTSVEDWKLFLLLSGKDWQVFFYSSEGDLSLLYSVTDEIVELVTTKPLPTDTIRNLQWIVPFCIDGNSYRLPLSIEEE
jgi:8-oxo-dGTP diphosphatase